MERAPRRSLLALALPAALLAGAPAAAAPGCESLAVFGTTCARCHEAECSGRLTFDDPSRARAHVQRYTGPLADERVAELVELLRVTKEQCQLDPAAAASCGGPPWDAARLRRVHVRSEHAWFLPLGTRSPGPQHLALRFDRDVGARLRISAGRFEVLHESSRQTHEHRLVVPWSAAGGEPLFLRLEADADAELLELRVETGEPPP